MDILNNKPEWANRISSYTLGKNVKAHIDVQNAFVSSFDTAGPFTSGDDFVGNFGDKVTKINITPYDEQNLDTAAVMIFSNCGFGGSSGLLEAGSGPSTEYEASELLNDGIDSHLGAYAGLSSIRVPKGLIAILY